MSSFLCFICHSTVNTETNEETREKYREVVGINLCPDSQICYICCYVLNKLCLFRSICLKRSLEYPVLFREKGTLNLQKSDLEINVMCTDECNTYQQRHNYKTYQFVHNNSSEDIAYDNTNEYVELEDENDFHDYFNQSQYQNVDRKDENDFNYNDNEFKNTETSVLVQNNQDIMDEANVVNENVDVSKEIQLKSDNCLYSNDRNEKYDMNDKNTDVQNNDNIVVDTNKNENDKDGVVDYSKNDNCNDRIIFYNDNDINKSINESRNINDNNDINVDDINTMNDNIVEIDNIEHKNDEINNVNNDEINGSETSDKIKAKKRKGKKKEFKKIVLSLEEQKANLEANRRDEKYVEAEFKCYNCALGFLFKDTYQAHMMRHEESNGEYQCPICTLRFTTSALLRCHTASHSERYRCSSCDMLLKPKAKRRHPCFRRVTESVACHLCGNMFKDGDGLQQHLKRVHTNKSGGRLYVCSVCGQRCNTHGAHATHAIKHINRKFPCDKCGAVFSSPRALRGHRATHREAGEMHYCTCGVPYASRKSLMAHRRNTVQHQSALFECPICTRVCPNQRALASHIQTVHSTSKDFVCPECPARYTSRKSLVSHIRTRHRQVEVKMAVCHLCGNSFKGNNKLNRHLREVCEKAKLEEQLSALYD